MLRRVNLLQTKLKIFFWALPERCDLTLGFPDLNPPFQTLPLIQLQVLFCDLIPKVFHLFEDFKDHPLGLTFLLVKSDNVLLTQSSAGCSVSHITSSPASIVVPPLLLTSYPSWLLCMATTLSEQECPFLSIKPSKGPYTQEMLKRQIIQEQQIRGIYLKCFLIIQVLTTQCVNYLCLFFFSTLISSLVISWLITLFSKSEKK